MFAFSMTHRVLNAEEIVVLDHTAECNMCRTHIQAHIAEKEIAATEFESATLHVTTTIFLWAYIITCKRLNYSVASTCVRHRVYS